MVWSPRFAPGSARSRVRPRALALILVCLATGCTSMTAHCAPSRTDEAVQAAREEAFQRKRLQAVPEAEPQAAVGEVPPTIMTDVRNHLAGRTGGGPDAFEVVRAQEHEWPDGAMGCPQSGLMYTQRPVRGYWIVLAHQGRDYDYRVSESGMLVLCEAMALEDPPLG
jgi:hypothetical protein